MQLIRGLLPGAGRICASLLGFALLAAAASAQPSNRISVYGAIAPQARTSYVGGPPGTFFLRIINATGGPVTGCHPIFPLLPPGTSYQTTDIANQLTGAPNTAADVPTDGQQGFLLTIPTPVEQVYNITPEFQCDEGLSTRTPALSGGFSVAGSQIPDVIAIGVTASGDGVARVATTGGATFMAVAGVNIGAAGQVEVSANSSSFMPVPATLTVCETNPSTGACLATPAPSVTVNYGAGETRTFTLFAIAQANGGIPFWPDAQRIHLNFEEVADDWNVGDTSVAITAPAPAGATHGPSIWLTRFEEPDVLFSLGLLGLWGDGRALFWGGEGLGLWGGANLDWLWSVKDASIGGNIWTGQPGNVVIAGQPDTVSGGIGLLDPRLSFLGAYGPSGAGQSGTFRAVMDATTTDFATSPAALAGNYDLFDGVNGTTDIGDATINANGTWSGQYTISGSTNCLWSGQFSQESGRNFFTIEQAFQTVAMDCPSTFNGKTFSGFATEIAAEFVVGFAVQETVEPYNAATFRLVPK